MNEKAQRPEPPRNDELILREEPMTVLVHVGALLGLGAAVAFAMPAYRLYSMGMMLVVAAWGMYRWKRHERFAVDDEKRTIITPAGHTFALDEIKDIRVSKPHVDAADMVEVMIHLGGDRWVPIFIGDVDEAKQVASFVENARTKPKPIVTNSPTGPAKKGTTEWTVSTNKTAPSPKAKAERHALPAELKTPEEWRAALVLAWGRMSDTEGVCSAVFERSKIELGPLPILECYADVLQRIAKGQTSFLTEESRSAARKTMASSIQSTLAYGYEIMPWDEAYFLTDTFFAFFAVDARFFIADPMVQVNPNSTFDGGVVVCDDQRIGIVWVHSNNPGR